MKTRSFPLVVLVIAACISGPHFKNGEPSSPAVVLKEKSREPLVKLPAGDPTRTYEVGGSDRVSISSILQAVVRQGDHPSVAAYGPADLIEHLKVKHANGSIDISLDLPKGKEMKKNDEIVLLVTTPRLKELEASGITKVMIEEIDAVEFDLSLSGISEAQLVKIACTDLEVDLSGTAQATIFGETQKLQADVSGASQLHALDLRTIKASVEASGASAIELQVKEELRAEASGASSVKYSGSPTSVEVNSSGVAMINVISH